MHSLDELIAAGYSIQNAKITSVSLNTKDYGCLTLAMPLEGGGYCLGKGYLGAKEFEGSAGARIILWTNRVGEPLETAIKWCEEHGLRLDAVNDNLPESVEFFGTNTRKIYADEFIDDRMTQDFDLPYYGGPKIKELSDEELITLYRERHSDGRNPIINYWPHETIKNAIVVELYSGSQITFYVTEKPKHRRIRDV